MPRILLDYPTPALFVCDSRGRFGRQGRFLIDRVPVWDTQRKRKRKRKWKEVQYARPPFSLRCVNQDLFHYKPARPTTYAAVGFETEKVCVHVALMNRMFSWQPQTVCPYMQVFEPLKVSFKNLEDIYALSDSEDELFEAKVETFSLFFFLCSMILTSRSTCGWVYESPSLLYVSGALAKTICPCLHPATAASRRGYGPAWRFTRSQSREACVVPVRTVIDRKHHCDIPNGFHRTIIIFAI